MIFEHCIIQVRAVQVFREVMDEARPGDNVGIQIENYTLKDIRKGDVCGDTSDDPPQSVTQFTAQVSRFCRKCFAK